MIVDSPPPALPFSRNERSEILRRFLAEDIGAGDATTEAIVGQGTDGAAQGLAEFEAKSALVLAGMPLAIETLELLDPNLLVVESRKDGCRLVPGDIAARVRGAVSALLGGERVALNLLQHLCGIATLTSRFVEAVAGTAAKILDTRKTTPGLRAFEKYAVRVGGGENHRRGLDDAILIKDNHLRIAGGVRSAIRAAARGRESARYRIRWLEVEVSTLEELREAAAESPDVILLDNFTPDGVREAIQYVREAEKRRAPGSGEKIIIEASGGIRLDNVRQYADAGADWISVGALTHSAPAADISMEIRALQR